LRLLLDSHAFIWACNEPEKLSTKERECIQSADNVVFISVATAWEIAIKTSLGKLQFPIERLLGMARALNFEPLLVSFEHAARAGSLPRHHNDPFDRMLVAQAMTEGLTLVTADRILSKYEVSVLAVGD